MRTLLKQSHFLTGLAGAFRALGRDARRFGGWRRRDAQIRAYFAAQPVRKIQLGSGKNLLPGWLNTDFNVRFPEQVYLDATRRFPFDDASFDRIYSEHFIGELNYEKGGAMLRECWRVLKPGGRLRVATVNLASVVSLHTHSNGPVQQQYLKAAGERYFQGDAGAARVINNLYEGGLLVFIYDAELLRTALEQAGFREVRPFEPGASDDPLFAGLESHGKVIGEAMNRFETMVMEATKPK